jgi:ABC-2 type transport system permease protein
VQRFEYLLGKLSGVMLLLLISVVLMSVLFWIVLSLRVHNVESGLIRDMAGGPRENLEDALRQLHDAAYGGSILQGIFVIYLKACVLASLTLFISTFATSAIFTIMVAAAVYFIGHLQPIAREYWLENRAATALTKVFVVLVSLVFPDLQIFNLTDDIVAGNVVPMLLFWKTTGLGALYVGIYLLVACMIFWKKEL